MVGFRGDQVVAAASLVARTWMTAACASTTSSSSPRAPRSRPADRAVTVHRWGQSPGDTSARTSGSGGSTEKSIFIVDENDRDCDGFPDEDPLECRPNVYRGRERPKRNETSCVTTDALEVGAETSVCVLGGGGCVDGRGPVDGTCDPSTTCVQPTVCVGCTGRADGLACMANLGQQGSATTRVECSFVIDAATGKVCPGAAALAQPVFARACMVETPYLMWAEGKWHAQGITVAGVTFNAPKQNAACDFKLEASGMPVSAQLEPIRAVVSVQFANGRSAAVPLGISFTSSADCGVAQNACNVEGEPTTTPSLLAASTRASSTLVERSRRAIHRVDRSRRRRRRARSEEPRCAT